MGLGASVLHPSLVLYPYQTATPLCFTQSIPPELHLLPPEVPDPWVPLLQLVAGGCRTPKATGLW